MAHELTIRKNGFVEMAYLGECPWHGLGQTIDESDSIDVIAGKAGMDWAIESAPVEYFALNTDSDQTGAGLRQFDGHKILYRSDTGDALSVVSSKFKIVQPGEVIEFFRDLCEANRFKLVTAGTLFGGKQFWAQADIGESETIGQTDKIDGKLLLVTSCDGSLATIGKFVNERVVCRNTLSIALDEADRKQIRVSHRSTFDPTAAKKQLGIAQDAFGQFMAQARALASKQVSKRTAENFVAVLLADATKKEDVTKTAGYQSIMDLFENGKGNGGATAWDLLNGVTEYVDHVQRAKTQSHRLASAWFGRGDSLKSTAFDMACALS